MFQLYSYSPQKNIFKSTATLKKVAVLFSSTGSIQKSNQLSKTELVIQQILFFYVFYWDKLGPTWPEVKCNICPGCRSPPTPFRFAIITKIETEENYMTTINLRDFYPSYTSDLFIEVPDNIAKTLLDAQRIEKNYIRRMYWNKAHYSLDVNDGIENKVLFVAMSPCEMYERKLTIEQLYSALKALPDKQSHRVYAHYILGLPQKTIAKAEGVSEAAVSISIDRGLKNLESVLKKIR